jgi:hypothetical protein
VIRGVLLQAGLHGVDNGAICSSYKTLLALCASSQSCCHQAAAVMCALLYVSVAMCLQVGLDASINGAVCRIHV